MKTLKSMFKAKRLAKREWIFLSVSIIIIFALLSDKVSRGAFAALQRLDAQISLNERTLLRLKGILRQAKELDEAYAKIVSSQKVLKDSDNVLQEIEAIARKTNVNILNMKPTLSRDEGAYKVYSIRIESQDDIPTFARFLYALTEELKGVGAERLQVSVQNKDELPRISLTMNAIAFKE